MGELSKYDVLRYLAEFKSDNLENLAKLIRKNIFFEKVSDRSILDKLNTLKKEDFVIGFEINNENKKTIDCLSFLYWCRMKDKDYNILLNETVVEIFKIVFETKEQTFNDLIKKTKFSKPTILKYLKILEDSNFVNIIRSKQMVIKANLNDLSFFYINFLDFPLKKLNQKYSHCKLQKITSKKTEKMLIKLHTYSTTVTEGNTATEKDVESIFKDYPTELAPREITEILNTKKAIERVYKICNEEITLEKIKGLHRILMSNLLEVPGEFHYGNKRVVGFKTKFPGSKEQIHYALEALLNFCAKESNPIVKAAICHFIFVSIHPFIDGNGRIARLLHSWILLSKNYPLFAFDPETKYAYFNLLEKARSGDIGEFIDFCVEEHYGILKDRLN